MSQRHQRRRRLANRQRYLVQVIVRGFALPFPILVLGSLVR